MAKRRKHEETQPHSQLPRSFQALHEANLRAGQTIPGQFPTDRFVAFIDILGFRDLIDRMFRDEPELFRTLLEALETAKAMSEGSDPENVRAVTAFSDSVVISEGGPFGTAGVLAYVRILTGRLLMKGVLCRGGIAKGRTYHAEGILFLVEDPIPRLKRDKDGKLFVNCFNYFWKPREIRSTRLRPDGSWDGELDESGLMQARRALVDALARAKAVTDPCVLGKVLWAVEQFNETLDQVPSSKITPIALVGS
jgi:hypothetical protein